MMKNQNRSKSLKKIIIYSVAVLIIIGLTVWPLAKLKYAEFAGSDGRAKDAITEINPEYKPWFSSIYKPQSSEIESMLFALQAAIGAGIIGYGLGYMRGKSKKKRGKSCDKY
jgi:cobalt/nickel transport protein